MTQETKLNGGQREVVPWNKETTFPADITDTARMVAASGYYPDIKSVAQAAFKLAIGRDMGFGLLDSLNHIHVIETKDKDGKPKPPKIHVGYVLLAAMVDRHPDYSYKVEKKEDDEARIAFFRRGHKLGVSVFSMEDARRAGLVKDYGNWKQYPGTMLFARAMSHGVKTYCPSVLGGVEVGDDDAFVIEGTVVRDAPAETHGEEFAPEPWPRFWAQVRQVEGYDGPDGRMAVHRALGVAEEDGALREAVERKAEAEGKTVAEVLTEVLVRLATAEEVEEGQQALPVD